MNSKPTEGQLAATIRDFGWHMGANLCFAIMGRRTDSPMERSLSKVRMLNFRTAALDAKRHGTYGLFQEGAKAATKGFLHSQAKDSQ